MSARKKHLGIAIVGHVDTNIPATTMGLLFELGCVSERVLKNFQQNEQQSAGRPSFLFRYFMPKHKDEPDHGIDITNFVTREFFTESYHYTIIDASGHNDFIKNIISGSSNTDVALLLVPANKLIINDKKKWVYDFYKF